MIQLIFVVVRMVSKTQRWEVIHQGGTRLKGEKALSHYIASKNERVINARVENSEEFGKGSYVITKSPTEDEYLYASGEI